MSRAAWDDDSGECVALATPPDSLNQLMDSGLRGIPEIEKFSPGWERAVGIATAGGSANLAESPDARTGWHFASTEAGAGHENC